MAVLTHTQREALSNYAFAIPETRDYPIHDINHARNALARVSQFGDTATQSRVREAVYAMYPQLIPNKQIRTWTIPARAYPSLTNNRPSVGQIIGIPALKKQIALFNKTGRKVVVYYMGEDGTGRPVYRYEARQLKPSLMKERQIRMKASSRFATAMPATKASIKAAKAAKYPMASSSQSMGPYRGIKDSSKTPGGGIRMAGRATISETFDTHGGRVAMREVKRTPNRHYYPDIKAGVENKGHKRSPGKDLGAGVVREKGRQHIHI